MLRMTIAAGFLLAGTGLAFADGTCKSNADDKKLAGAARNSFLTKCTKDAIVACDTGAASKKLSGAAKTSFTKKCVNDATGT